jgi:hypothetical protein
MTYLEKAGQYFTISNMNVQAVISTFKSGKFLYNVMASLFFFEYQS